MDLQQFLSHLDGVTGSGDSYTAKCPAHEDQVNSLSVGMGDNGGIVVNCHAGCTGFDVVESLGLSFKELMPDTPESEEITYDYHDESGELLFQVVRKTGKKFLQRQPGENGDWIYKMNGVRRVVYHLPKLKEAIKKGEPVFVVEGEKDVHTLERMGLVGTTSPAGAGKWSDEYADSFKDARVYILPDNDNPGRDHAKDVARSLIGKASQVFGLVLPVPEKGDISDWTLAGGTREKLARMCQKLRPITEKTLESAFVREFDDVITAVDLFAMEFREPEWIVPGILPEGATLLAGREKTGKSYFAINLATSVAFGGKALGHISVTKGRALYLYLEGRKENLQKRLTALLQETPPPPTLNFVFDWPAMGEGGEERLEAFLQRYDDTRLVVIDTLKRVSPDDTRSRKGLYDKDYEKLQPLTRIAEKYGVSFLVIHHANKMSDSSDPFDKISGTTGLAAAVDTAMVFERSTVHEGVDLYIRGRDIEETTIALSFDKRLETWIYEGDSDTHALADTRRTILEAIVRSPDPMPLRTVVDRTGLDYNLAKTTLHRMKNDRQLTRVGRDGYALHPMYEYKPTGDPDKLAPF